MNEEKDPLIQQPNSDSTSSDTSTELPPQESTVDVQPSQGVAVTGSDSHKKLSKKLILLILLIIAAAAAAWYFYFNKSTSQSSSDNKANVVEVSETAKPQLIYAVNESETNKAAVIYAKPLDGGDEKTLMTLTEDQSISMFISHKNNIAFSASTDNIGGGESVYVSTNGGKNFDKVYEGKKGEGTMGFAEQITSIKFSDDGSSIVIGSLQDVGESNIAKEIILADKKVSELFTVDQAGLFIEAYDKKNQKLYYFKGCYNCDGNTRDMLYVRDLQAKTDSVVSSYEGKIGEIIASNSDLTRMLILKSTPGDGLGGGAPYSLDEITLAPKSSAELYKVPDETFISGIGYREGDNKPYFAQGSKLFTIDSNNKVSVFFESDKPIFEVYYVDQKQVVLSLGDFEKSQTVVFSIDTQESADLVTNSNLHRTFGVVRP